MAFVTDYTVKRLGSKPSTDRPNQKIARCLKCGRKGLRVQYKDGGEAYTHKTRPGMFGMEELFDSCLMGQIGKANFPFKEIAHSPTTPSAEEG